MSAFELTNVDIAPVIGWFPVKAEMGMTLVPFCSKFPSISGPQKIHF